MIYYFNIQISYTSSQDTKKTKKKLNYNLVMIPTNLLRIRVKNKIFIILLIVFFFKDYIHKSENNIKLNIIIYMLINHLLNCLLKNSNFRKTAAFIYQSNPNFTFLKQKPSI